MQSYHMGHITYTVKSFHASSVIYGLSDAFGQETPHNNFLAVDSECGLEVVRANFHCDEDEVLPGCSSSSKLE